MSEMRNPREVLKLEPHASSVERKAPSPEIMRITEQMTQACTFAVLEEDDQRRSVDAERPSYGSSEPVPDRSEDRAKELMATPEFAACAKAFQEGATQGLADGRQKYPLTPHSFGEAALAMEGLPGADTFFKRALMVASMPKIVELTRAWQQRQNSGVLHGASDEMPRDIQVELHRAAREAAEDCHTRGPHLPAARFVVGVMRAAERREATPVGALEEVVSEYLADRAQDVGGRRLSLANLEMHDPKRANQLLKLAASLIHEARGYVGAQPPFIDARSRQQVAMLLERHGLTEHDLLPGEAYGAGLNKAEKDGMRIRRSLAENKAQEQEVKALEARRQKLQGAFNELSASLSETEKRGQRAQRDVLDRYAAQARIDHSGSAETRPELTNQRNIESLTRELDEARAWLKQATREARPRVEARIKGLEEELIRLYDASNREFNQAYYDAYRGDLQARRRKDVSRGLASAIDAARQQQQAAEARTHRSTHAHRQDQLRERWLGSFPSETRM